MIQSFHYLQKYCDDILNSVQPLMWEKINFLVDVRKDIIYIIDVSTVKKAQTKNPRANFSSKVFGLFRLTSVFNSTTVLFTSFYIH